MMIALIVLGVISIIAAVVLVSAVVVGARADQSLKGDGHDEEDH